MSRFTLDQMRTFLTVVRLGGLHRASVALGLTQPAITARIKNLERALACELFERTSGGMKLTKRGELLLAHAEKFEHLVELVQRDVVDPSGVEGRLRIGASETVAQCWLPELVSQLHTAYPRIEIELKVDVSLDLREALLSREIDLAILLGPISEYSTDNIVLPGFDLAWYTSAKRNPSLSAIELLQRPVLSYARNTRPFRELKEELFERLGPDAALFPSTSLSACFRLVEADMGVAALPRALGREYVRAGRIIEFDPGWVPSPLQFTASFLREPKSHLNETAAALALEVAKRYAESDLV
ncbi:MAG: LysR family transcriptional regulator [Dinoroseobacter sp.]|nr:LysR family transcriptional regulator [Dinoroseobacter sp.]